MGVDTAFAMKATLAQELRAQPARWGHSSPNLATLRRVRSAVPARTSPKTVRLIARIAQLALTLLQAALPALLCASAAAKMPPAQMDRQRRAPYHYQRAA